MKSFNQWMLEYAESHQNTVNIKIHTVAVPIIFIVTIGLLWLIPNPEFLGGQAIRIVHLFIGLSLTFYLRLGFKVFLTMFIFVAISIYANSLGLKLFAEKYVWFLLGLFAISWFAQFYGHKIEGKKPSFLNDLQFLLIGPVWVFKKINVL